MTTAVKGWEVESGAGKDERSRVFESLSKHRTLWIGVLYASTILVVLAVAASL